jgi:hypothetical protein
LATCTPEASCCTGDMLEGSAESVELLVIDSKRVDPAVPAANFLGWAEDGPDRG